MTPECSPYLNYDPSTQSLFATRTGSIDGYWANTALRLVASTVFGTELADSAVVVRTPGCNADMVEVSVKNPTAGGQQLREIRFGFAYGFRNI